MSPSRLPVAALVAAVLVLGAVAIVAIADDGHGGGAGGPERTLSATGSGELEVTPDRAVVRLGVTARGADAAAATRRASDRLRDVIAAARDLGVEDLKTEPVCVSRVPAQPGDDRAAGAGPHVARQAITVRLRALDEAGRLIAAATRARATDVSGPRFTLADPDEARNRALARAIRAARRAADRMAAEAGVELGAPVRIEDRTTSGPEPLARAEGAAGDAAPPTVPGPVKVSAQVRVVFAVG